MATKRKKWARKQRDDDEAFLSNPKFVQVLFNIAITCARAAGWTKASALSLVDKIWDVQQARSDKAFEEDAAVDSMTAFMVHGPDDG